MKRTSANLVLALALVAATISPATASPSTPEPPTPPDRRVTAPIMHPLDHRVTLQDALREASGFRLPVIGFHYTNPTVTGAFFPNAGYSPAKFLEDYQSEHGSLPQVDAFLTAPGTTSDVSRAAAQRVALDSPKFDSPRPRPGESRAQRELSSQAEMTASTQAAATSTASWFPAEAVVRNYEANGNAILKSSYTWDQSQGGSLSNLDSNFGLEVEINLQSDGYYSGIRPFCAVDDVPVGMGGVKEHFWAQNQNWSSWWVTTLGDQSTVSEGIQAYADYNDLTDNCNEQSIGVGIGKPANLPHQDQPAYGFMVQVVAPKGNVPVNLITQSGLQPVHYDCDGPYWGGTAHTDCMAVPGTPYPDPAESYFQVLNETGAASPEDPATRHPVSTPDACWTLVTGQVPQRINCSGLNAQRLAGWGANWVGELGRGDENAVTRPAPAALGALQAIGISFMSSNATGYHNCALAGAELYCWGDGSYGALGNNDPTHQIALSPVKVDVSGAMSGTIVTKIETSYGNTCVLASGKPFCWGNRWTTGLNSSSDVPVAIDTSGVLAGKTLSDLALSDSAACVVADGKPYCWGSAGSGQLGDGGPTGSRIALTPVPVDVSGVLNNLTITDISAGWKHMCAIASSKAHCWGANWNGELGNGSTTDSNVPVAVGGVLATLNVTALSAGYSPCAIADGQAYCWGSGLGGVLGTGIVYSTSPGPKRELTPRAVAISGVLAGKTVTHIAQGDTHTCVLADGQPYCWGDNTDGQLGTGSTPGTISWAPVSVATAGTVLESKVTTALTAGGGSTIVAYAP